MKLIAIAATGSIQAMNKHFIGYATGLSTLGDNS
jgi:hypothetical protein